jgi:cellulose synthase/poly-beta-1,6-N-acetylglucosamine synthase-like glycosyltransferase
MNSIVVSVIIPVYNDWHRLSFCLNALSGQTFSSDKFEVIVVNNNPDDTTPSVFKLDDNCKIITENKPGSYAARNAGLEIANGKIIGFTDSDCIPDKNWIKNAVGYLSDNNSCSRIGGKIEIFFNSSNPGIAELYDKLFSFNQKRYVESAGTSVTANLFTYKFVFDKVGYFDSNLMSGGDYSWGTLAQKNGYKIDYVENVIVNHPARETLKDLIKKEKRVGGSQAIFLKKNTSTLDNITTFIKELRPRIGTIKSIFKNGKELTFKDKLYITLVRHYLLVTRAYSKLRVEMGRKANRA